MLGIPTAVCWVRGYVVTCFSMVPSFELTLAAVPLSMSPDWLHAMGGLPGTSAWTIHGQVQGRLDHQTVEACFRKAAELIELSRDERPKSCAD